MRTSFFFVPTLILTMLLSGCGGSDGVAGIGADGKAGTSGANGANALMAVSAQAQGETCTFGGMRIDAGLDLDGDGTLASSEVRSTQYACNGATGAAGAAGAAGGLGSSGSNTLAQMLDEPAGTHCTMGGKAIRVGVDRNGDGVLDASEVSGTDYLCNGPNGANGSDGANGANGADGGDGSNGTAGSNGTNGLNMLVSIAPAGVNCANGGSQISSGLDSNANGVLDAGEVTSTAYICNGAPTPPMSWVTVTGTAAQALSNTGYIASNDAQPVVVTLPANPAVGDIVSVSGIGLGGWTIAQNAGQAVYTRSLGGTAGANWTPRGPASGWKAVASSADGRKLVALKRTAFYTSTDAGLSWTAQITGLDRDWSAVASSADGSKLVATVRDGRIYTSDDSGASWTARESVRSWRSVASSADGSHLIAAARGSELYTSTDSGVSWTPRDSVRNWELVASSADGSKLAAGVHGGQIYTSTDSGATWTPRAFVQNWKAIASSADGNKLVAVVSDGGQIYTSTDAGLNWTPRESGRDWKAVASSADGTKLVAAELSGRLYTSTDAGVSWTPGGPSLFWQNVASSADGSRVVGASQFSSLYTSIPSTTPGVDGSISGGRLASIELQYVGGGMFNVLSHEGSLTIQ